MKTKEDLDIANSNYKGLSFTEKIIILEKCQNTFKDMKENCKNLNKKGSKEIKLETRIKAKQSYAKTAYEALSG